MAKKSKCSRNGLSSWKSRPRPWDMAAIQSQLTALTPALDKINNSYFEKSHEDAFFFHTNTLYLLLTVDRQIEAELQVAETERQADKFARRSSSTPTRRTRCTSAWRRLRTRWKVWKAGCLDKMSTQTKESGDRILGQIKLLAPDQAEIARRQELAAEMSLNQT